MTKEEAGKLKVPFGKYAGETIEDVPNHYLEWAAEEWDEKSPTTKAIRIFLGYEE